MFSIQCPLNTRTHLWYNVILDIYIYILYRGLGRTTYLCVYNNESGRNVNNSARFRGFPVVNNVIECGYTYNNI